MASKLSLEPQDIDQYGWYYEERHGIGIYNAAGFYTRISWKKIARSVDRWRREKQRLAKLKAKR